MKDIYNIISIEFPGLYEMYEKTSSVDRMYETYKALENISLEKDYKQNIRDKAKFLMGAINNVLRVS